MPRQDIHFELLVFEGCPNAAQAAENIREAARREGVRPHVRQTHIWTPEAAVTHRFLGSPSVRLAGSDVDEAAHGRAEYGLMCRTYAHGSGAPAVDVIRAAIRRKRKAATT